MKGYSIYPVKKLKPQTENSFVKLWKSCDSALDVTLKNPNDWSFNPENMEVTGCSVNIQKEVNIIIIGQTKMKQINFCLISIVLYKSS